MRLRISSEVGSAQDAAASEADFFHAQPNPVCWRNSRSLAIASRSPREAVGSFGRSRFAPVALTNKRTVDQSKVRAALERLPTANAPGHVHVRSRARGRGRSTVANGYDAQPQRGGVQAIHRPRAHDASSSRATSAGRRRKSRAM